MRTYLYNNPEERVPKGLYSPSKEQFANKRKKFDDHDDATTKQLYFFDLQHQLKYISATGCFEKLTEHNI